MMEFVLDHSPRVVLTVLATAMAGYVIVRVLAEMSNTIAGVLGPLGRRWASARDRRIQNSYSMTELQDLLRRRDVDLDRVTSELEYERRLRDEDAWNADLQKQVSVLRAAMSELRDHEAVTSAYLVYDHHWHMRQQLGVEGEPYVSFVEFARKYRQAVAPQEHTVTSDQHDDRRDAPDE